MRIGCIGPGKDLRRWGEDRDDRNYLALPVIRPQRAAMIGEAGLLRSLEAVFAAYGVGVPRAGEDWRGFVETLGNLKYSEWPVDLERARLWYEPHLDRIHEDADTRRADLIQLEQIAAGYPSRERFLTELTLDPPDATSDQAGVPLLDEDYLILYGLPAHGAPFNQGISLKNASVCLAYSFGRRYLT